jgi:hypothetical protein
MATAAAASMTLRFSSFDVTRQAFFRSSLSMGIVNLRPIVDQRKSLLVNLGHNTAFIVPQKTARTPIQY